MVSRINKRRKVATPVADDNGGGTQEWTEKNNAVEFPLTQVDILTEHENKVTQIEGHPTSRAFISASKDGSVIIWKGTDLGVSDFGDWSWAASEKWMARDNILTGLGHCNEVTDVNISLLDDSLCVTSSLDRSIILWDLKEGRLIRKLSDIGDSGIQSVSISSDSHMIATGSLDGCIRLLDLRTSHEPSSKCLMMFKGAHVDAVQRVRLNPVFNDNSLLSCGSGLQLKNWDIRQPIPILYENIDEDMNLCRSDAFVNDRKFMKTVTLEYAHDGKHFVCGGDSRVIDIWRSRRPFSPIRFLNKNPPVTGCRFSPDYSHLAAARGNTVILWNVQTRRHIATVKLKTPTVPSRKVQATSVAWSCGSLMVGMDDGNIGIFQLNAS